jgi:putative ABC transport system permease protein
MLTSAIAGSIVRFAFLPWLASLRTDAAIAFRSAYRQRRRSLIGVLSVTFGVVCLLLAAGFIEWIYWAMREDTTRSRMGHIQVARDGFRESGVADPFSYLLPDAEQELEGIRQTPGVITVAPRLMFSGLVSLGDTTLSFVGEGASPDKEESFDRGIVITAGQRLSAQDPRGIVVGHGLATNLGLHVGDKVVLLANTRSGGVNATEVHVRGLFSTVSKAFDDSALRVPLPVARELLRVTGAHTWVVLLDDTARTRATVDALNKRFSASQLEFVPWYELADFYNKTVELFSKQVGVMKLIIAIIIVLSISNTQTMSVLERTSEIGTSMALGVTRAQTLRRFLLESLAIGLVGGLLGLVVGASLALLISAVGIPMPPPPGMAHGFTGEIRVTWPLAFDAVVLAVVTTLFAGVYPALKASRMEIVDALRHAR